jgi:hypothetical protein
MVFPSVTEYVLDSTWTEGISETQTNFIILFWKHQHLRQQAVLTIVGSFVSEKRRPCKQLSNHG